MAELLGTLLVAAGQGDRQGKLQLLQLMLPFRMGIEWKRGGLSSTLRIGDPVRSLARYGGAVGGGGVSGGREGHGWLSFYFATFRQPLGPESGRQQVVIAIILQLSREGLLLGQLWILRQGGHNSAGGGVVGSRFGIQLQ